MSYSDIQHFSNMISGCESLITGSRPAADKYVGITPEDSIVQFYSK